MNQLYLWYVIFISSAILGEILWDSIKTGVPLTLQYIKEKSQDYILDAPTPEKLKDLSKQLPVEAKKSEDSLSQGGLKRCAFIGHA